MKKRLIWVNLLLFLGVMGGQWAARADGAVNVEQGFLSSLPLPFQGWQVTERPLTPSEIEALEPDSAIIRRYASPEGMEVELAVIAGHKKRSVHTPAYCMPGTGWEIVTQTSGQIALENRILPASRMMMTDGKGRHLLVVYFYTDGDYSTTNLVRFQTTQFMKRLKQEVPLGALVRILVPVQHDLARAERLSEEFARATLPAVMQSIKKAKAGQPASAATALTRG